MYETDTEKALEKIEERFLELNTIREIDTTSSSTAKFLVKSVLFVKSLPL